MSYDVSTKRSIPDGHDGLVSSANPQLSCISVSGSMSRGKGIRMSLFKTSGGRPSVMLHILGTVRLLDMISKFRFTCPSCGTSTRFFYTSPVLQGSDVSAVRAVAYPSEGLH